MLRFVLILLIVGFTSKTFAKSEESPAKLGNTPLLVAKQGNLSSSDVVAKMQVSPVLPSQNSLQVNQTTPQPDPLAKNQTPRQFLSKISTYYLNKRVNARNKQPSLKTKALQNRKLSSYPELRSEKSSANVKELSKRQLSAHVKRSSRRKLSAHVKGSSRRKSSRTKSLAKVKGSSRRKSSAKAKPLARKKSSTKLKKLSRTKSSMKVKELSRKKSSTKVKELSKKKSTKAKEPPKNKRPPKELPEEEPPEVAGLQGKLPSTPDKLESTSTEVLPIPGNTTISEIDTEPVTPTSDSTGTELILLNHMGRVLDKELSSNEHELASYETPIKTKGLRRRKPSKHPARSLGKYPPNNAKNLRRKRPAFIKSVPLSEGSSLMLRRKAPFRRPVKSRKNKPSKHVNKLLKRKLLKRPSKLRKQKSLLNLKQLRKKKSSLNLTQLRKKKSSLNLRQLRKKKRLSHPHQIRSEHYLNRVWNVIN